MSWRSPAACRDATTQAGGPGLFCAESTGAEGRALDDTQAASPVSHEAAVQTDESFDNQPPCDALLLEASNHGEEAGSSCRQHVAILTVLGMPDEQVYAHAQATGDGTLVLQKGYDRMRQEICSLAAKKQGFQLLEWSLRRLKTSVGATCFLAWRLHTEGAKSLRQRSAPEEVRVRERRTRALGVTCLHGWRLLAEGAKTQCQQPTSEETRVSHSRTRTWAVKAQPKSSAKRPEPEDSGAWAADETADAAGEEHQWANVQDEVEYFLSAHEVDVNAAAMLRRADPDVQRAVLDQGDLSFANNQTAALISRIRAHGGKGLKGRGKGQQASTAEVPGGVEQLQLVEKVKEFQKLSEAVAYTHLPLPTKGEEEVAVAD